MSILPFDQRDGFIWMDGQLLAWGDAKLHVLSHGLHYGGAVFEGERAYGGKIFKSPEHSERFQRSADFLDFEIPYSVDELDAAKTGRARQATASRTLYVRPVAWRGSRDDGGGGAECHHPCRHRGVGLAEHVRHGTKMKGIRLDIAEYRRPDPKTAPSLSKAAGLYMICTISKHRAERRGYADALMFDWQGRVAECTGANVFFIKDGKIHTPIADCFLDGITRQTVIDLAKARGLEVIERRIMPDELASFSECFICGTAAEVTPVSEILDHHFTPGAITRSLIEDYNQAVRPESKSAAA